MPYTINDFKLGKTLGQGFSAKVKLATGPGGEQYALKIFDLGKSVNNPVAIKYLKNEVNTTMELSHQYIVKYHKFEERAEMQKPNG